MNTRGVAALVAVLLPLTGTMPLAGVRVASAQFSYEPAGELESAGGGASRPGAGRTDDRVYAPGMRFPIESGPAYANSQIYGHGGYMGPGGGECDTGNYSYPWYDNYCEERSWSMPLCPSGQGHQGQDVRPATCADGQHWAVAAADGTITNIGSYSVYLTADDGTRYDYLHMRSLAVSTGQQVTRGQRLGRVSDNFGSTETTVHLHFNIRQNVSGVGSVFVPPYMSLVRSYEALMGDSSGSGGSDRPVCGNGRVETGEGCDDGNLSSGDGCDGGCRVESGWECSGAPSRCQQQGSGGGDLWCGDGHIDSGEECDDDNTRSGDGCDANCRVEVGWSCGGEPSRCTGGERADGDYPECGDARLDYGEECDDGNIRDGDGCDGDCWLERGWYCSGEPSRCTEDPMNGDGEFGEGDATYSECGNGAVEFGEDCDDGGREDGDGCGYGCRVEAGWRCTGVPSRCDMLAGQGGCGDGWIEQGEACDDGNSRDGDGCSADCRIEAGYRCIGAGPGACLADMGGGASGPPTACALARPTRGGAGGPLPAALCVLAAGIWRIRRRRGRFRRVSPSDPGTPGPLR